MKKIVIFGGTIEGRLLVEKLVSAIEKKDSKAINNISIEVFVATEYGKSLLPVQEQVKVHVGRLGFEEIEKMLLDKKPDLCMDATHPYAVLVTENIFRACKNTNTEYLRVKRGETELPVSKDIQIVYRDDIEEAVSFLETVNGNIFITTGSKELESFTKLSNYEERCIARVLPTLQVFETCRKLHFEGKNLIAMQGPFSEELNYAMLCDTKAKWLVTKNSGAAGGFLEKCEACIRAGVNIVIIGRKEESVHTFMRLEEAIVWLEKWIEK